MNRISMQDIAKAAGVSRNTVSLALRQDPQVAQETRRKIERLAEKMGYVRDPILGEVMAGMRGRKREVMSRVLALVNANPDPQAFRNHPTIPTYVEGCRRRATELGYKLDSFWMHDPKISGKRFCSIFQTRNIRGVLIVGMMDKNRLPEKFLPVIEQFPAVVTGVRTRDPGLSFACVDHHMLALRAFEAAIERGYKRPGLVLDESIDTLIEHRFSAGYRTGQLALPKSRRLEPFFQVPEARKDPRLFKAWMEKEKPDVIFTLYHEVADWLARMKLTVPDQVALIQYEWRPKHADWAGMNQHNDMCGEAAVDMLLGMIHRGETGPPPFPRATMIGPSWVNGKTAPGAG
jgi:LacI family transcriptional regulator